MKVRLHTEEGKYFKDNEWKAIHAAFEFFIREYGLDKYGYDLYVRFPKNLGNSFLLSTHGNCVTQFYRLKDGTHKVMKFTINISPSRNIHKITNTIFHEMTHVMQELRGYIARPHDKGEIYKGVYYSVDKLKQATYKEYKNFPWEIEARQVADEMMAKWYAHSGIKLSFWGKLINNYWS